MSVCADLKLECVGELIGVKEKAGAYHTYIHTHKHTHTQTDVEVLCRECGSPFSALWSTNIFVIDPVEPHVLSTTSNGVRGLFFPLIMICYNTEAQQEFLCSRSKSRENIVSEMCLKPL